MKGRYDTYDTEQLLNKLKLFQQGLSLSFPVYSRQLHDPLPDKISVAGKNVLLMLEGQWLLRNDPIWEAIRQECSFQYYLDGPADDLKNNVIRRHTFGGRTEKEARSFYENSDYANAEEVRKNSIYPDETLLFYKLIR